MPTSRTTTSKLARRAATATAVFATGLGAAAGLAGTAAAAPAPAPAAAQSHASAAQHALQVAARQQGDPYQYGASGPNAFDCSGLTQFAYQKAGIALPHNAQAQKNAVTPVSKANMRPGDLVFFANSGGHVYHVGIYAGHNKIWQAPQPGQSVKLSTIWTSNYTVGRPA